MSEDEQAPEELSPAEQRVRALLGLLRSEPPASSSSLTLAVMRTARWQAALREVIRRTGAFASGLVTGIDLLLGIRRRPRGR